MPARRWCAILAAAAMFCAPAVMVAGDASADAPPTTNRWAGVDGNLYEDAPFIVLGKPGTTQRFLGWDFDNACRVGAGISTNLNQLNSVAKLIEKSGRKAVFTIAPNKASAVSRDLDLTNLPHHDCDLDGLDGQEALLDHYSSTYYVPLRTLLDRDPRKTFWDSDAHWTTVGGSIFAKALARKLSPALAKRQKYYSTERTLAQMGNLAGYGDTQIHETAPALLPTDFVKVKMAPGSVDPKVGLTFDLSWNTTPKKRTWPGHTLLLGDSMSFVVLENLMPLFNHGRYIWQVHTPVAKVVQAVLDADTVVMELIQWSVSDYGALAPALRAGLKEAFKDPKNLKRKR